MVFRRDTPLDDVLKYVTRTTKKANRSNDPGIPFYVDPFGLAEAQKTLTSSVKIDVTGDSAEGDDPSGPRATEPGVCRGRWRGPHQLVREDPRASGEEGSPGQG